MTNPEAVADRAATACLLAAAAICSSAAVHAFGHDFAPALTLLLAALGFSIVGLAAPRVARLETGGARVVALIAGVGAMVQLALLATHDPGMHVQTTVRPFQAGLVVAGVLIGSGLSPRPWLRGAELPLMLGVHLLMGIWLIGASPNPHIDVFVFQRDALDAMLRGIDPYSINYPDIYWEGHGFYGPGLVVDGRLQAGYIYPPVNLLLELPGHLLGDVRYSHAALFTAGGALIALARPGRLGFAAAALYLFAPRAFFVIEQAWTEPDVVFLLAVTVFCALRMPRMMPYALGVFLASKQYLVVAAPLLFLLVSPFSWRAFAGMLARASAAALLVTLPFVLHDFVGFWHSVVMLQTLQPFRYDALSIPAALARGGAEPPGAWLAFAALIVPLGLAFWRSARTPSGFAASLGAAALFFFAFNKQAFTNYYFFAIGALCVAVGAANLRRREV